MHIVCFANLTLGPSMLFHHIYKHDGCGGEYAPHTRSSDIGCRCMSSCWQPPQNKSLAIGWYRVRIHSAVMAECCQQVSGRPQTNQLCALFSQISTNTLRRIFSLHSWGFILLKQNMTLFFWCFFSSKLQVISPIPEAIHTHMRWIILKPPVSSSSSSSRLPPAPRHAHLHTPPC